MGDEKKMGKMKKSSRDNGGSSSVGWVGASKILVEKTNRRDVSDFYILNLREEYEDSKVGGLVLRRHSPGPLTGVETKFFAIGKTVEVVPGMQEEVGDVIHSGGASYYDASSKSPKKKWMTLPAMMHIPKRERPRCVSLGSKIFVFGGVDSLSDFFGEYYDVANNSAGWRPVQIPSTVPVDIWADFVSDPLNNRILCTFYRTPSLYAYYPNRPIHPWVCIHDDKDIPIPPYMCATTPIDGILLYYSVPKFVAYDIQTNQTLQVSWSSNKPFAPTEIYQYTFQAFLSLGNDILCMPDCEYEVDPVTRQCTKLILVFYRFHARRHPPKGIVFTPLSVHHIPVEGFKYVRNFLPL